MSPLNSYVAGHNRQRGAIGLVAALTLALAVLCMLLVVDSGRLYLEKRSLQRVADMAALEAASRKGNCQAGNSAFVYASQSAVRNGFTAGGDGRILSSWCGVLALDANLRRTFTADSTKTEAIKVVVSHSVPRSIAAGVGAIFDTTPMPANVELSASAVAAGTPPLAKLTLRSTLTTVDSTKAAILNPLIGGLLGGALNLSLASWQGLAATKLNLFSYLNQLKTDLNLTAVDYTQVLGTSVAVSQLIQSSINVLEIGGILDSSATILGLQALKAAAGSTTVVLGDLIKIQGGSNVSALESDVGLLDLVQSLAQVANKKNGVAATAQINLPGLLQVKTQIRVIEPPQLSAMGDPTKINPSVAAIDDPNRIYVRTAQMRALVSINLPALGGINPLVNATTSLVGGLTPILNNALSLNIKGLVNSVSCLLGATCQVTDFKFLTGTPASEGPKIDLSLSLASAESYVAGYTCNSNTDKSLTVHTNTALLSAKLGLIDTPFPVSTDPSAIVARPIPVLDIGTQTCTQLLLLFGNCTPRVPFGGGGLGLSFNTLDKAPLGSLSGVNTTIRPPDLPEVGQAPHFGDNPVTRLPSTLLDGVVSGVKVDVYKPVSATVLGDVITGVGTLLSNTLMELDGIVEGTLKPLLASVADPLLAALGVTIAPADVGANLSCNFGQATLVI
jgi:uncharacterized membrane protein